MTSHHTAYINIIFIIIKFITWDGCINIHNRMYLVRVTNTKQKLEISEYIRKCIVKLQNINYTSYYFKLINIYNF